MASKIKAIYILIPVVFSDLVPTQKNKEKAHKFSRRPKSFYKEQDAVC